MEGLLRYQSADGTDDQGGPFSKAGANLWVVIVLVEAVKIDPARNGHDGGRRAAQHLRERVAYAWRWD